MGGRDEHWKRRYFVGDPERIFVKAEQVVGASVPAASEVVRLQGIYADLETLCLQGFDRILEVGERSFRETSEIDDVGAVDAIGLSLTADLIDREPRGIGDLGEYPQAVMTEVRLLRLSSEELREIAEFLRTSLHVNPQVVRKSLEIAAATPGDDDPISAERVLETSPYHIGGHQRGDTHAELMYGIGELRLDVSEYAPKLRLSQFARQEENVFRHASATLRVAASSGLQVR
jgi:hypothetical protein